MSLPLYRSDSMTFPEYTDLILYLRDIQRGFAQADSDSSKSLDAAELQELLRSLAIYLSVIEVELHMKRCKLQGKVSFEGLVALLNSIKDNKEAVKREAALSRQETKKLLVVARTPRGSLPGAASPRMSPRISPRPILARKTTLAAIQSATASKKSQVQQIIDTLSKTPGKKYEDPEFPTTSQSLCPSNPSAAAAIKSWKRTTELSTKPQLFIDGADEGDVMQGALGDCTQIVPVAGLSYSDIPIFGRLVH
jgi:hypothetical protein